jgi:hypothetical protein
MPRKYKTSVSIYPSSQNNLFVITHFNSHFVHKTRPLRQPTVALLPRALIHFLFFIQSVILCTSNSTTIMLFTFVITKALAFLGVLTLALSTGLQRGFIPQSRSLDNIQPATFRGDYGGHAYELNGTVNV